MRKFFITTTTVVALLCAAVVPVKSVNAPTEKIGVSTEMVGPPKSTKHFVEGNYFSCGLVFTDDGYLWEYYDNSISNENRVVLCYDETDKESVYVVPLETQDGSMYYEHY